MVPSGRVHRGAENHDLKDYRRKEALPKAKTSSRRTLMIRFLRERVQRTAAKFQKNRFLYVVGVTPFILAAVTIFWNFPNMGLSHWDEYYWFETAAQMMNLSWGSFYLHETPLFPFLLSIMFRVFGLQDYVAVVTSGLMALLLCVLTFWWAKREYDFFTATVSVAVLASTALFISYAKIALTDMTFTFFFSASIFAYVEALKRKSTWGVLAAGLLLACALATKYTGFQSLLIVLIFVPFASLTILQKKVPLRKRITSYLRQVAGSLTGVWVSLAPVLLLLILFLVFLGAPTVVIGYANIFAPTFPTFTTLGDFIPRLFRGVTVLESEFYQSKSTVLGLQFLVNPGYYGYVLTEFVGLPTLILALVGGVRGILKRQINTVLLIIWVAFVLVYFASLPGFEAPRLILPLIVPLAILSGLGTLWCATTIVRLLQGRGFSLRRRRLSASLKAGFVIAVVLVNLYSSIPAIADTHSAYRQAMEFLVAKVPDLTLVWTRSLPVIYIYYYMFHPDFYIGNNITQISHAYAIVLDYEANEASPDYLLVQRQISQMTLAARIWNDAGEINMLDSWTPLSGLQQFAFNLDRMTIRIYLRTLTLSSSSSQSYSVAQLDTPLNLFPSIATTRRTVNQFEARYL